MFFLFLLLVFFGKVMSDPPNIVLIIADDMGYNDVTFRGSGEIPTPNLDALAYTGRILNRHYVLPSCTPSRSALMTGVNPIKLGTQGYPIRGGQAGGIDVNRKILPQYLKDFGYKTHLVGKWHLGYETPQKMPQNRGFDTFFGYYNGYTDYYNFNFNQTMADEKTELRGFDLHDNTQARWDLQGQYATDLFTTRSEEIIRNHDKNKPLFLCISHLATHTGAEEGDGMQFPTEIDPYLNFPHVEPVERRNYAAIVQSLDESVGKTVRALEESEMLNRTLILFLSDNGAASVASDMQPNFGSNWPLRGVKFTLYEGGVRGTALLWGPGLGIPKGLVDNQFYHITDWVDILTIFAGGRGKRKESKIAWRRLQSQETESVPRNFLLNIDSSHNSEAAILKSRWKIVKQNMLLYANYDRHFTKGSPVFDSIQNQIAAIWESSSGEVINKIGLELDETQMQQVQNQLKINCKIPEEYPIGWVQPSSQFFCHEHCIFDILKDPCELNPLSNKEILQEGQHLLNVYRKMQVPPNKNLVDADANPALFGGVWSPWMNISKSSKLEKTPSDTTSFVFRAVLGVVLLCVPKLLRHLSST